MKWLFFRWLKGRYFMTDVGCYWEFLEIEEKRAKNHFHTFFVARSKKRLRRWVKFIRTGSAKSTPLSKIIFNQKTLFRIGNYFEFEGIPVDIVSFADYPDDKYLKVKIAIGIYCYSFIQYKNCLWLEIAA